MSPGLSLTLLFKNLEELVLWIPIIGAEHQVWMSFAPC